MLGQLAYGLPVIDGLSEALSRLDSQLAERSCHLLMQVADRTTDEDERFNEALVSAGLQSVLVKIAKLPPRLWPVLIPLQLSQSPHSLVASLALAMAVTDTDPKALRQGSIQRTCAWIWTDMTTAMLAQRIATNAIIPYPGGLQAKHRWLRYYDPMVTDLFFQACDPEHRCRYLQDMSWAYVNRWQELEILQAEKEAALSPGVHSLIWERLDSIGSLNQAWIRARCEGRQIGRDFFRRVADTVLQGHHYGLRKRIELDLFAWQAITLGPDFHKHKYVQVLLEKTSKGADYDELAYQLDDADWDRIGLETSSTTR